MQQMFVFQLQERLLYFLVLVSKRLRPTGISGSKDTSCFDFSAANCSGLASASISERGESRCLLAPLKSGLVIVGNEKQALVLEGHYRHTTLRPVSNTADMPAWSTSMGAQTSHRSSHCKRAQILSQRKMKLLDSFHQRGLAVLLLDARVKKR